MNKVRVYFVYTPAWAGDDPVTAIFVDHVGPGAGMYDSYAHLGQHVGACRTWIEKQPAATPVQFASLLAELERAGYTVDPVDSLS